jgi:hypothetical protein
VVILCRHLQASEVGTKRSTALCDTQFALQYMEGGHVTEILQPLRTVRTKHSAIPHTSANGMAGYLPPLDQMTPKL